MTQNSSPSIRTIHLNPAVRVLIGLALSVLGGVMLAAAFAPYNLWFLGFLSFIPITISQYRLMPPKLSSLGNAVASGLWVLLYFGPMFIGQAPWFIELLPLWVLLLSLLAEQGSRNFHEKTRFRWFILQGVSGWIGFEIIRTFIGLGTWGFIGYTLWNQTWLLQPLSIFGIYGASVLVALVGFALAQAALAWFDRRWRLEELPAVPVQTSKRWLAIAGVVVACWTALSLVQYLTRPTDLPTVRVALIQPGVEKVAFHDANMPRKERLDLLANMTRQAAAQQPRPQVIVWSELALPFDPQQEFTQELRTLAAETDAYLVIAYGTFEENGVRNEVTVLSPQGEFLGAYAKTHPTSFGGEQYSLNRGVFPVYDTPLGKLSAMICYDLNYTDVTRKLALQGAQMIAVPSHDWTGIVGKQNAHLPYRAIENRVALLKAETAYDSALVDPYGHIIAETRSMEREQHILAADVPLSSGPTIYSYTGDVLGWLGLAGMIFFMLFSGQLLKRAAAQTDRV